MLSDELPYDLILCNGTIIDGSGSPGFTADVAVRGDRISAVGRLQYADARRSVDVSGLVVAPGFIDVHTHDDAAVIEGPEMTPKITQGVTTVIGGNCGISGAPYSRAGDPPHLLHLIFKSDRLLAQSLEKFLQRVCDAGPAVNAAFLTGHSTLRMQVMGADLEREATPAEMHAMRELLTQCLEQGSLGLSTGLFYPSARAASTTEVIEIAQALRAYRGVYATHMRDEADGVVQSIEESLLIGREAGVDVVISHHKCIGRKNFGRSVETLALLDRARATQGVAWDVYPYNAGSSILLPEFVEQASRTVIAWCDPHPEFAGVDLDTVAQTLGCTRPEAIQRLQPAGAIYFMMDEADVARIISSSGAMIGSDGLPSDKHPHPRLWGTFPRILGRYVREQKLLTLEDAVHRMTGLSALRFGLTDRGQVRQGSYADVCVFDPGTVLDAATFERPAQSSIGIRHVLVNGRFVLESGEPTGARSGRVLRRCTGRSH